MALSFLSKACCFAEHEARLVVGVGDVSKECTPEGIIFHLSVPMGAEGRGFARAFITDPGLFSAAGDLAVVHLVSTIGMRCKSFRLAEFNIHIEDPHPFLGSGFSGFHLIADLLAQHLKTTANS